MTNAETRERPSQPTSVWRPAITFLALYTVVFGLGYPALVTGVAQTFFPTQANGSLVRDASDVPVGSALIGQAFADPAYFASRPSATATPYDGRASTGSNLGPTNPALLEAIEARVTAQRAAHVGGEGPVPVDLVTTSASGLDPHLSPAAALYQAGRVAEARGVERAAIEQLVAQHVEGPLAGVLGAAHVDVLALNRALDARFPRAAR